jgi:hypothetical protein
MFGFTKKKMTYAEVNEVMSNIATPLSLYLMPVNYEKERERFFDSNDYNPQFKYRRANKNKGIFSKLKDVHEITDIDPEISSYIINVIEDKRQAAQLLDAIGEDDRFVRISEERFRLPSEKLFSRACKILRRSYGDIAIAKRDVKLREKIFTYDELVPIFEMVFTALGLEGWSLDRSKAIESKGFRTAVKTKRVMVDPEVKVSAEKLRKTIIHEVATHALRADNGFKTGYDVFGKPNLKEYLDDEEGLAMYNEEKFGVLRDIDLRRRAALVYAMYIGRYSSFRETFNALSAVYPKRNAFSVVFRVKRGLSDTSRAGCYYRDSAYLRGFLKVRKRLENDAVSYKYMYAGKIPLKYLYLVEEGIIPKPKVVPTKELMEKMLKEAGLVS